MNIPNQLFDYKITLLSLNSQNKTTKFQAQAFVSQVLTLFQDITSTPLGPSQIDMIPYVNPTSSKVCSCTLTDRYSSI